MYVNNLIVICHVGIVIAVTFPMRLDELLKKSGCLLAVVIDNEGNCLACEHKDGKHTEAHDRVAKALSEVTSTMENLAVELELATGRSCLPLEGWSLMSRKILVVMGDGGFRGAIMETPETLEDSRSQDPFSMMIEEESEKRIQIPELAGAAKG